MIATKEQELKAVEKIRKIVESLGTDSYVGTAMEGVLEIAEENIQNDFACSMKNRAELAERELKDTSSRLSGKINELQNTIEHLQIEKKGLQAVNTRLLKELEEEEEWKAYGCRTDFADIQNKKECGGNRQWQNHYLRNWAANTKGKGII